MSAEAEPDLPRELALGLDLLQLTSTRKQAGLLNLEYNSKTNKAEPDLPRKLALGLDRLPAVVLFLRRLRVSGGGRGSLTNHCACPP